MPKYQIQDNQTGKTVTIEGDSPPSQADAEEIFKQAGLRNDAGKGAFRSGLSNVPVAGGLLDDLFGGIARGGEFAAEGLVSPVLDLMQKGKITNERRFMSPQDYESVTSAPTAGEALKRGVEPAAKAGANVGAFMLPLGPQAGFATKLPLAGPLISKLPGALPTAANLMASGGTATGLQEYSQADSTPESILQSIGLGMLTNPLLYGTGNLIKDKIPRYLGMRAYGKEGTSLPEVIKAEQGAGGKSLKEVRDAVLNQNKGMVKRDEVIKIINDLAKEDQWVGTPGLSNLARTKGRMGYQAVEKGALGEIKKAFNASDSMFDFYNRLKNMAYPSDNSASSSRLGAFMRAAAHRAREFMIENSDDPQYTRNAMDLYANQTAMNRGVSAGGSSVLRQVNDVIANNPQQAATAGLGAILATIPSTQALSPLLLADAALTNRYVGPKIASGLVKAGESQAAQFLGPVLQKLGVMGLSNR